MEDSRERGGARGTQRSPSLGALDDPRQAMSSFGLQPLTQAAPFFPPLIPVGLGVLDSGFFPADTLDAAVSPTSNDSPMDDGARAGSQTPKLDMLALAVAVVHDNAIVTPLMPIAPLPSQLPFTPSPPRRSASSTSLSLQGPEPPQVPRGRRKRVLSEHLPIAGLAFAASAAEEPPQREPDRPRPHHRIQLPPVPNFLSRSQSPWLHTHRKPGAYLSPAISDVETPNLPGPPPGSYFAGALHSIYPATMDQPGPSGAEEREHVSETHTNGHAYHSKPSSPLLEETELEAAEALGGLRHAGPGSPPMEAQRAMGGQSADFLSRVANYPAVNSGIAQISRIYEAGKESHAIVKYGAETVESVGTTVIQKLQPALGAPLRSLDRFATTSLDRLEQYVPGFKPSGSPPRLEDGFVLAGANSTDTFVTSSGELAPLPPPSPGLARGEATAAGYGGTAPLVQRKPRSTWSTIVTNVGGYVISEETMRGLRYCLQWLQYATQLIDSRIQLLKSYLARLVPGPDGSTSLQVPNGQVIPADTVANAKKDVVETLRNVVDVVGRYAAVVLPSDSRDSVRGFVLSLPSRFSRLATPSVPGSSDEASTVLTFASESRTVLGGVENVFRQSFERAESVLNRIGFSTSGWNSAPEGTAPTLETSGPGPQEMVASEESAMDVDDA